MSKSQWFWCGAILTVMFGLLGAWSGIVTAYRIHGDVVREGSFWGLLDAVIALIGSCILYRKSRVR